jgi:acyl-CoA thioesterase FadM
MNLYFRLIWIVVRSLFKSSIDFADKISLNLHILPNDLDINRHLNNGRYLTLLDLANIEFFIRSGVLKHALRKGFRPMLGGLIVTYRKGLSLFERCTLTMQIEAWDEHWNYFRFEFRNSDDHLSAAGYIKGAFVSKKGIIPNKVADKIFGHGRGDCKLPPAVANWIESENAIMQGTLV